MNEEMKERDSLEDVPEDRVSHELTDSRKVQNDPLLLSLRMGSSHHPNKSESLLSSHGH